jgi:membrane protein YqaA with SNARE-associated domain
LAVTILAGDLIALVYNLLGGEFTTRFLLKVATVAVIAGGVFGYYLSDLRQEERE